MMTPEVSRFVRDVMLRGRSRVNLNLSDTLEAVRDRWEMWWRTEDRMRWEGQRAQTVDDLPQWLLDLAERLGVER